jgi:hypothetical protein
MRDGKRGVEVGERRGAGRRGRREEGEGGGAGREEGGRREEEGGGRREEGEGRRERERREKGTYEKVKNLLRLRFCLLVTS